MEGMMRIDTASDRWDIRIEVCSRLRILDRVAPMPCA